MSLRFDRPVLVNKVAGPRAASPPGGESFDILDQFIRGLETCTDAAALMRHLLQTIRVGFRADAVFSSSGSAEGPVELISDVPLSATWCRDFLRTRLQSQNAHRGSCYCFDMISDSSPDPIRTAQSSFMIRLSKSRDLWIVGVSFSRDRLFREEELKIVLLLRRLYLEHRRQAQVRERLTDAVLGVVRGLNEAISAKSPFTSGHSERVARMAVCLGRQMGLTAAVLSDLHLGGLLHDIGKIGIRDNVLQKPGPLTDEENLHIREHPVIGDTIVAEIKPLAHLRPCVRHHHERFDGLGYPDRLAGEDIPLLARILNVVDAYDAMISPRPYRSGMAPDKVDAIMSAGAGTQWDPRIIEHFMACRRRLYGIFAKGNGDSVLRSVEEVVRTGQEE